MTNDEWTYNNKKSCESHKKIKPSKAPGPDSLLGTYYRCFEDKLLQPLQNMMNSILQEGKMVDTWKEVNITLIPKDGQDFDADKKLQTNIIVE